MAEYITKNKKNNYYLVSFPVKGVSETKTPSTKIVKHAIYKYREMGCFVPGFHLEADLSIIKKSAHQLMELINKFGWKKVLLPRPGCGAGGLSWNVVNPVIKDILDDRVIAIHL